MPILKKGEIKVRATAYGTEVKSTGYVFYSYDKKASALFFQFRNQNGETTDIANAKIRLLLIKNDDEDKEFIPSQEDFEIISKPGGKAKFVLPEMLLAYQGKVTGYIYLDFEDGSQTDEGQFTFRIRRSMITHVLPEAGDKYVQDFEDVKERVEQAGDSATKDIEKAKDDAESQIGDYVGEVESAKDSTIEDIDKALPEVEDKLDEVAGKISELDISDTNLLKGTSDKWQKIKFSIWNYYFIDKNDPFYVNEGETYTASVLVKDVKTAKNGVALYLFGYSSDDELIYATKESDTDRVKEGKLKNTITIPEKVDHITMSIRNPVRGETVTLSYKEVKLQRGKYATDWKPNPSEIVTQDQYDKLANAIINLGGSI